MCKFCLQYITTFPDAAKNPSPPLKPYPDWATNNIYAKNDNNATKIVSTFRVRADECDRLWVMDTGLADILGKPDQITPPKILIYDLKTDKVRAKGGDFMGETLEANFARGLRVRKVPREREC